MPNWKKVVVSGSDAHLASLHTSADITGSGKYISGSATTTGSFGYIQTVGEISADSFRGDGSLISNVEGTDPNSEVFAIVFGG
jgi:hypothetical protein